MLLLGGLFYGGFEQLIRLASRRRGQRLDQQRTRIKKVTPAPPTSSWRDAESPAQSDHQPLPHFEEVITDPERFADRELVLRVRISIDTYYNWSYGGLARDFYCFCLKAAEGHSYQHAWGYLPRGEEAEELRRRILDVKQSPEADEKELVTFIKIYIHSDRLNWELGCQMMGELLATAATREELDRSQHHPTLPPLHEQQKEEAVARAAKLSCGETMSGVAQESAADFFARYRPSSPTLLHIKTDLVTYADQMIVIPAKLSAVQFYSFEEEERRQSYFAIEVADETESHRFYLLKCPAAIQFRDELILKQGNSLQTLVKILIPKDLNQGYIYFLNGEILGAGEELDSLQEFTPTRTLFETSESGRSMTSDPPALVTSGRRKRNKATSSQQLQSDHAN